MAQAGGLEKLMIEAYRKSDYSGLIGQFAVQINPESYSRSYEICYNNVQPQGASSGTPEFNRTKSDTVNFDLVFDASGVVPAAKSGQRKVPTDGIAPAIEEFLNLVFDFNGNIHSPNFLRLLWGKNFIFDCRLTKLDLDYKLFRADGTPIRASAKTSFTEYTNKVELAKEEHKSSPDLSHVRIVKAGDTLPLMCNDIYGSSDFCPQVAAANDLTGFRNLAIGSEIVFPPLSDKGPTA